MATPQVSQQPQVEPGIQQDEHCKAKMATDDVVSMTCNTTSLLPQRVGCEGTLQPRDPSHEGAMNKP